LSDTYLQEAKKAGGNVRIINIAELNFIPFFKGFDKELAIEDDIYKSQQDIEWANHIVFFYPIWGATMPAMLKSFIERTFVPGFANKNKDERQFRDWQRFLEGKTARVISTMDSPPLFYIFKVKDPGYHTIKDILNFCGIKSIKKTYFGPVKISSEEQRDRWIRRIKLLGKNQI
jgi:putative NADPH-quinone reductase